METYLMIHVQSFKQSDDNSKSKWQIFFFRELNNQKIRRTLTYDNTATIDNCFDLIRSHEQCIQRSPSLEIEPAPTVC